MAGASAFFQPQKLYVFFPLCFHLTFDTTLFHHTSTFDTSFVQLPPLHQHPYINFLASLYHSHCKFSVFNIRYYSTVFSSTPIFSILHLTTPPPLRYSGYHISVKALVKTKSHLNINIHSYSTANHIYTKMAYIYLYDIVTCVIFYSSTAAFRTPHPSQAHTTHLMSPHLEPRLQDG